MGTFPVACSISVVSLINLLFTQGMKNCHTFYAIAILAALER